MGGAQNNLRDPPREDLPRSIFVPSQDPRKDLRETVDLVLSDRFMAFLSVILVPVILLPFFVNLSPQQLDFFDLCDATVIFFFVVEYASKLYLARSRWEYFKAPWHLLDLTVVLLSFISYLPILRFGSKGSATLLVRLLRLPRAFAVGGRTAGSRIRTTTVAEAQEEKPPQTVIRQIDASLTTENDALTWDEVEEHLATREQEWIDIYNISEEGILRLSSMLRVPPHHFRAGQVNEIYPHVDYLPDMSFIFLQSGEVRYPERAEHYLTVVRRGEVIVCRGPKIISASPHGLDLFGKALTEVRERRGEHSFVASVLYGILDSAIKEYRTILTEIEGEIFRIGSTPRSRLPRDFLQRMYELSKEVNRVVSNIVHFKELIGVVTSRKVPLEGFGEDVGEDFGNLQDEVSYLNEIGDDIVERIHNLIDLYINQSSFETNRVLKILAVITALAIIPSALGGILGMNLLDMPYPLELWQIVAVIVFTMSFVAYCFVKLGWLRA